MMSHTKTFDCEGCRPYCYGGYHMREDADGDGDYVLAEDFNRVKKQHDELLASVEKALLWNKSRKYIMPYRIRDPLLAALISAKGGA